MSASTIAISYVLYFVPTKIPQSLRIIIIYLNKYYGTTYDVYVEYCSCAVAGLNNTGRAS